MEVFSLGYVFFVSVRGSHTNPLLSNAHWILQGALPVGHSIIVESEEQNTPQTRALNNVIGGLFCHIDGKAVGVAQNKVLRQRAAKLAMALRLALSPGGARHRQLDDEFAAECDKCKELVRRVKM